MSIKGQLSSTEDGIRKDALDVLYKSASILRVNDDAISGVLKDRIEDFKKHQPIKMLI